MTTSCDVVILGAGPVELVAAWRAAGRGFSVRVVDRADAVGGSSASFGVAGVRVNCGSHRLSARTPPRLLNHLRDLFGDDLQTRPRITPVRRRGAVVVRRPPPRPRLTYRAEGRHA